MGIPVLKTARKLVKVTGINLVDETSELMVISQFGKIIRIDTKSIRAAGRSTRPSPALSTATSRAHDLGTSGQHFDSDQRTNFVSIMDTNLPSLCSFERSPHFNRLH